MTGNRGISRKFMRVAIDDHSRLATATLADGERRETAVAFLYRMVAVTAPLVRLSNGS